MSSTPTSPRVWILARSPAKAEELRQALHACGIHRVQIRPARGWDRVTEAQREADLVVFHGAVDAVDVEGWISALGKSAVFLALEGDPIARHRHVRSLARSSFERGGSTLRTRMNLLAANARGRRRIWTDQGSVATVPPAASAPSVPPRVAPATPSRADLVVFLGSSGAPEQLQRILPVLGRPKVPIVLAVHHPPSQRTAFRSLLTRLASKPVAIFGPTARGMVPGLYVAPAPLGLEAPGPDLNAVLRGIVGEGLVPLVCVGSGMGEDGLEGAAKVHAAGGRVVTVHAEACVQPSMVQAAWRAGVADANLTLLEMAALWAEVTPGGCAANDAARRSPAA